MEQATEIKSFNGIVKSLVGNVVTVVNPESYEGAPVGYALRTRTFGGGPGI